MQRREWKRWWGSSQLPVSPGHKVGVFLPAVRVLLRPWSCPMKLVEDGTPRPGHRNPPGLGQRSSGTWCMAPKYCSFHPAFAPVLVNVSVITNSNNSTESEKIQLEMFLVSEAQSAQQSLVQGALATAVSWVTVGQNESSGSAGGSAASWADCVGSSPVKGSLRGETTWVGAPGVVRGWDVLRDTWEKRALLKQTASSPSNLILQGPQSPRPRPATHQRGTSKH